MHQEYVELSRTLKEKFEIEISEEVSEQAILQLLELRISQLLERTPEEFFQLMYRIDIPEPQLNVVLQSNDAIKQLAKLIYDRQLQKVKTRLLYKEKFNKEDMDSELDW